MITEQNGGNYSTTSSTHKERHVEVPVGMARRRDGVQKVALFCDDVSNVLSNTREKKILAIVTGIPSVAKHPTQVNTVTWIPAMAKSYH
jgi:hypothetical protein